MSTTKATILKYMKTNRNAVLATKSADGTLHTTAITYVNDRQCNIWFATKEGTIKYQDILNSEIVSLGIIDKSELISLNIEGHAKTIDSRAEQRDIFSKIGQIFQARGTTPYLFRYEAGDVKVVRVSPKRIKFCDYSKTMAVNDDLVF